MRALYRGLDAGLAGRAALAQSRLGERGLPLQVGAPVRRSWTVCTTVVALQWMLQYYLKAEGLALSWVGSGPTGPSA